MIPRHEDSGFLPAGLFEATWAEFSSRFGWNARRAMLLRRVRPALQLFASNGASFAVIGGSFVTMKAQPGDIDIAIELVGLDIHAVAATAEWLLDLSPVGRAIQKASVGAEFFPANLIEASTDLTMAEFLQQSRDGESIGVVRLDLSTV